MGGERDAKTESGWRFCCHHTGCEGMGHAGICCEMLLTHSREEARGVISCVESVRCYMVCVSFT